MALKKCRECGKEISTEAKVCPHCGKKNPTGERIGCVAGMLILFIVAIVVSIFSNDQDQPTPPSAPRPNPVTASITARIPYQEVEAWDVGSTIVIDPRYRTDSSMRVLGKELDARYSSEAFFNVLIYDSERAARLRQSIDTVTVKDRLSFYDRHFLGTYTKNSSTGFHALEYSLKGLPNAVPTRIAY